MYISVVCCYCIYNQIEGTRLVLPNPNKGKANNNDNNNNNNK